MVLLRYWHLVGLTFKLFNIVILSCLIVYHCLISSVLEMFSTNNYCIHTFGPPCMWQTEGLSNKDRTIFLTFLPEYNDTRPLSAHLTTLLAFHRQWHKTQHEWQLWQTVGNTKSLWYSQYCILKILQPFWTSGTWPGDCTSQGEGCFPVVYPKEALMFRN